MRNKLVDKRNTDAELYYGHSECGIQENGTVILALGMRNKNAEFRPALIKTEGFSIECFNMKKKVMNKSIPILNR